MCELTFVCVSVSVCYSYDLVFQVFESAFTHPIRTLTTVSQLFLDFVGVVLLLSCSPSKVGTDSLSNM